MSDDETQTDFRMKPPQGWRELETERLCNLVARPLFDEQERRREQADDLHGKWKRRQHFLRKLTKGQQYVISLYGGVGLTDNGGFALLFDQSDEHMINSLRAAFQGIGAKAYEDLLHRAQCLLPAPFDGPPNITMDLVWQGLVKETADECEKELDELDCAFYDLHETPDGWIPSLAQYIHDHPDEFFLGE